MREEIYRGRRSLHRGRAVHGAARSANIDLVASPELNCVIEIPKGSRNKYEYDPELGGIKLDRFLSASVVYPTDYGYVPETIAPDGDPLDVLVCVSEPTFPGCIVPSKAIGLFKMSDEKGRDDHVVCVPCHDPGWNELTRIDDLPPQLRREISHFFSVYKDLDPGRCSEVQGWDDLDAALETIEQAREQFRATAQ
jgi:inorganic pyrophosphatase